VAARDAGHILEQGFVGVQAELGRLQHSKGIIAFCIHTFMSCRLIGVWFSCCEFFPTLLMIGGLRKDFSET
jgi:hypothetical protein